MKKNGFINIPFHWLFVVLAGGFIMFLFAFFVSMGLQANQVQLQTEMLLHFDTIFSTLASSEMTETPIKLSSQTELLFSCDMEIENGADTFIYSDFQLAGGSVDRPMDQFPIFTNEVVSGTSIITKTETVDIPFTATSPLFIVDSDTRYVGFYKSVENPIENKEKNDRLEEVLDLLPANASKVIVTNFNGEGYKSYDNIVIITIEQGQLRIGGDGLVPEYFRNFNLRHIDIYPDDLDELTKSGETRYKLLDSASSYEQFQTDYLSVTYHSPGLLLGTIISPTKEFYECTVWKIMGTHAKIMLELLEKKAHVLSQELAYSQQCGTIYSLLETELENYRNDLDSQKTLADYATTIGAIESLNSQLEFESCPLIY